MTGALIALTMEKADPKGPTPELLSLGQTKEGQNAPAVLGTEQTQCLQHRQGI